MGKIDWRGIAEELNTITWTEHGRNESGGTKVACEALAKIIGDDAFRDAVDFYVSGQPGYEVARSVLWHIQPPSAMQKCLEIFRTSDDPQETADAICLLQVVADERVLDWIPEFLTSANLGARRWGIGIVDQLAFSGRVEIEDIMPLLELALSNSDEAVRQRAQQILETQQAAS